MNLGTLGRCGAAVGAAAVVWAVTPAGATPGVRDAFVAKYPGSTLLTRSEAVVGQSCYACHQPPNVGAKGNCYRRALGDLMNGGMSAAEAIDAIDGEDSDGDGVANGVEIMAARADLPGEVGYNPGLVGPQGVDNCSRPAGAVVTGQLETPAAAPACPADFNGDGFLDFFDYDEFVSCYESGECPGGKTADFNGDGFADFFDYDAFVLAYEVGC